jgi:hypothetical protein
MVYLSVLRFARIFPWMPFPTVTITLADLLPGAVAVESIYYTGVCPYPAHLFIEILAKVGYVENATSIVQVRINQVFPEASEHG